MFSLIVYTHMVVCIMLYCILASPFFLIAGIFCLLTGRPFNVAVLKFIRMFGRFMIHCWYSVFIPVRLDDFSGGANHGIFARMGGFIDVNNLTYEQIVEQTRRALSNSGTIYVFPEGKT